MSTIYYLGPTGTFSQTAAQLLATNNDNLIACTDFTEIIQSLDQPNALGVLPIENSITSNINQNADYIFQQKVKIVAEVYLNISFSLYGLKSDTLETINTVYSHPQALAQCQQLISKYSWKVLTSNSTAASLAEIKAGVAAIASTRLSITADQQVIKADIGDYQINQTRFLLVSKNVDQQPPADKLSVICILPHKKGSLALLLSQIATIGNLTKIESRPIPNTHWEYQFWLDIETSAINDLLQLIEVNTLSYYHLGTYYKGKSYD